MRDKLALSRMFYVGITASATAQISSVRSWPLSHFSFSLLRFLTPRGTYFLLNFSYANPREAAHVLTTIDFEQLVLCVTLHILPHSADLLAGAATAIEHAATIFRAAVNRERKISAAALQMRMEILLSDAPAQGKVDISHACVQRRLEQAFGFADA